jgi:exodeoxyribonuclease VII large subunit
LTHRLVDPRRRLADYRLRLDDLGTRLSGILNRRIRHEREYYQIWQDRLNTNHPCGMVLQAKKQLEQIINKLLKTFFIYNQYKKIKIRELNGKLATLSPLAILARGYSITRTIPEASILKDSRIVALNQNLEIILAKGRLICQVKGKADDGKKNL